MLLKVGSRGEDVKKLQTKLGLTADGIFGNGTGEAVKKWQAANGLGADGIVGAGTWAKMFPTTTTPTPAPTPTTSGPLKLDGLKGHIPDSVIAQIPETAAKFGINTPLRLAHFLAQCGHESAGFKATQENLNYGAKGLMSIFKKYFPTEAEALKYERKPEMIANRAYASRMGNGDEGSGDGWKFRGRGYIQCTGKATYIQFDKFVDDDIVANPDLVATKYPLLSAAWFWGDRNINRIADEGSTDEVIRRVTKVINGGFNGVDDRIVKFNKYYSILS